ncbi:hypothetical protein D3C84_1126410 [compost metagenome]
MLVLGRLVLWRENKMAFHLPDNRHTVYIRIVRRRRGRLAKLRNRLDDGSRLLLLVRGRRCLRLLGFHIAKLIVHYV